MRIIGVVRRLALVAFAVSAGATQAAEQVYELTINNWAATNPQGEVEITYRLRINPAAPPSRTSTASTGVVCVADPTIWKWASGNPSVPQILNRQQTVRGTAMLKAQGTWTGRKPARFWAVMGVECGSMAARESNLVTTRDINR